MNETAEAELVTEFSGAVARATFNRPSARNAMTWAMYNGLVEFCTRVDNDPSISAVVLRGAGGEAFVAGTDINQFTEFDGAQDGLAYEKRIDDVLSRLESLRVPSVAAIDGHAIGGGLSIAAACDLRICTPNAKFGLPIAKTVGNCVSMAAYARLAALIGPAKTLHLICTAEIVHAEEASATGLVSELVPADGLDARVDELCDQLLEHAPLTMRASKTALLRLREATLPPGDDLVSMCYGSADFREGVTAFVEKRRPHWRAR